MPTQMQQIQTAIYTFREKYLSLPSDMPNATDFWGELAPGGNTDACYLTESTGKDTCNGNGDGRIHSGFTSTGFHERARAWQHLSNAGLIEGSYTGTHGVIGDETRVGGLNTLRAKLGSTHWNLAFLNPSPANPAYFPSGEWHLIELTRDFYNTEPTRDILTPEEAWNIDQKMDDGRASTGKITGPKQGWVLAPDCTTSNDPAISQYNLSNGDLSCPIFFNAGF